MARKIGRYDSAHQMFIEEPIQLADINVEKLSFLRWMLLQGKETKDGYPCGQPSGELVDFLAEKAKREAGEEAAA